MTGRPLRLGTRASQLALVQSGHVADAVHAATGRSVELVHITTHGDVSRAALATIGGTGVFVTALREALLSGEVDIAVHSFKDLPTQPADGLVVAAVPPRQDPRDALVARDGLTLGELPAGSRIGTGSPRRQALLLALGLGLEPTAVRGNVDTRLRLVAEGVVDAVVLARAGLARLERLDQVTEVLDPLQMLPAPGQGALAVECRSDDAEALAALAALDDPSSRAAVEAERALLARLEAGCSAPVGALAEVVEGEAPADASSPPSNQDASLEIFLRGAVVATDGSDVVRLSATGPFSDAAGTGRRLADELISAGADSLLGVAA